MPTLSWFKQFNWSRVIRQSHIKTIIKDFLILALLAISILSYEGLVSEKEATEAAQEREAKALNIVQHCMNGMPLVTKNDSGDVVGLIVCQAAKEINL